MLVLVLVLDDVDRDGADGAAAGGIDWMSTPARECLRLLGKLTRGPAMRSVNLKVGGTMVYVMLPNTA